MPDDPAFIRRIAADPADDAPRLVYADYLDETGDPIQAARAEFIRVQIEKARLVPDTPRWRELWFREAALFDWARQWRAELPVVPGLHYGGFFRGFADGVDVHLPQSSEQFNDGVRWRTRLVTAERSEFLDRAGEVFDAVPVRKLTLSGVATDGAERLVHLDGFRQVVELRVFGPDVTPKLHEALIARGPWPNLRRLRISSPGAVSRSSDLWQRFLEIFRDQLE